MDRDAIGLTTTSAFIVSELGCVSGVSIAKQAADEW
jgi:hypothetical protein